MKINVAFFRVFRIFRSSHGTSGTEYMKTQYLAIIHIITYDDVEMSYAVGAWGTKESAEKSLELEKYDCGGYVLNSYFKTREVENTERAQIKLSPSQAEMLKTISARPQNKFDRDEWDNCKSITDYKGIRTLRLRGAHQHRTARSLEKMGLAKVFSSCSHQIDCGVSLPF